MKTHKSISLIASALLIGTFATAAFAQDSTEPKLTFTPSGRVLTDGALYFPDGDGFADGMAIPDVRLGGKATYGNWSAKIDIGYGFGKLSMKDVYVQYTFNDHNLIRVGNFVHQFGLQASTSSSMKPQMEAPTTDTYMAGTSRNLGIQYIYDKNEFFAAVSALCGANITKSTDQYGKASVGATTRLLWRPYREQGQVVQIGMSGWYQTAMHTAEKVDGETIVSPGYFDFSAGFPTRVAQVSMLGADVSDAKGLVKLSPEVVLSKDRFALEAQYYYMNVGRHNGLNSYTANGAYGLIRGLICGDNSYGYLHGDGGLAVPNPKTLEFVLGYNYTDGNDSKAGIYGGISNDYSFTLNYYVNKYVIARLRYSYTNVHGSSVMRDRHVNIIQARLMFKF